MLNITSTGASMRLFRFPVIEDLLAERYLGGLTALNTLIAQDGKPAGKTYSFQSEGSLR